MVTRNVQLTVNANIRAHVHDAREVAKAVAEGNLPVGVLSINVAALTDWARKTSCPDGVIFGVLVERRLKR